MATADPPGGDEELAGPRTGGRWGRIAAVLVVAVLVVVAVVRLAQHQTTPRPTAPHSTVAVRGVGKGPVIPTFTKEHPPPGNDISQTFELGRHRTRATIYGPALPLAVTCYGKQCTFDHRLPSAVRKAMRVAVPGCMPVSNESVRHRPGHAHAVSRTVACVDLPVTLVVNIVRLHASVPKQRYLSGGRLVVAAHVHGPFIVQVFLQSRGGPRPEFATARSLAADPRLLAGM